MTCLAYPGSGPRFTSLAVLSAFGLLACATPATNGNTGGTTGGGTGGTHATGGTTGSGGTHTGGTTGGGTGGSISTGGTTGGGTGGSPTGGTIGSMGGTTGGGTGGSISAGGTTGGGTGGSQTGGTTGNTGGTTGGGTGGAAGGSGSCANTNASAINEDASGYICGNTWGIQGAWYCYTSDTSNACNKTGAIPWNSSSNGMCLSGTIGTVASGGTALLGFKVKSGPPGGSAAPGSWDASKIVGFAITLASGSSGKGSGGSVVYVEYPTTKNVLGNGDAPGVTVPGVAGTSVTYNALFSDSLLANSTTQNSVDPTVLTDVKVSIPPDTSSRTYDFCITKVVPLTAAPSPVVPASSAYGPAWTNQLAQAVNGINGYAVQSAPFSMTGLSAPMSMQVMATSDGVGFTYKANAGSSNNSPAEFPAVISGWGPGEVGGQFYGPYLSATSGRTIGGTNKLTSVVSNWSFTMGGTGDAVYDVWFGNSANPAKPQIELMVWIGNAGKNPLGTSTGNTFMGRTAYTTKPPQDNGTGQQVVSYWVASPGTTSVSSFDLLPYFQDAASHSYAGLSNNSFLLGVQTGFEVYDTGSWKTTDYNISIK